MSGVIITGERALITPSSRISCNPPRFVRLTADEYFADPCIQPSLSSSIARELVSMSPRHAYSKHPRLGGIKKEPTEAMNAGSVIHALLLEGGKGLVEVHYKDFRTDAAKEDKKQAIAQGKVPVLSKDLEEAREVAAILKLKLAAADMVFDGETEICALWEEKADDGTIVPCRAMLDHFSLVRGMVDDLKTSRSADPSKIERSAGDNGYDIQAAAYESGVTKIHRELVGRLKVSFGFCEIADPFAVTVIERGSGGSFYELGALRWRRAINTWAWCTRNNRWPEYVTKRIRAEVPPYILQRELDVQAYGVGYADEMRDPEAPPAPEKPPSKASEAEDYSEDNLF